MNTFKKTLMAATMVAALGSTTSCGNKESSQEFIAGTPYTLIAFKVLEAETDCTVKFECEGTPSTYWDVLESEDSNHEKSHTYSPESEYAPVVLIEGNISSIWFCDENGAPLADGNAKIDIIMFSNTITSIREYACYGLELEGAYIPASVKTMGKNAFLPHSSDGFFCEPTVRPSGWDVCWCTMEEFNRFVAWGASYYITETGEVYVLNLDDSVQAALYEGNIFATSDALVIPKPLKVNNRDFSVISIVGDVGNAKNIKSVTIPDSVMNIGYSAFANCTELTDVKFEGDFKFLYMGTDIFNYCTKLERIILPEGLVNLPALAFEHCTSLKYVKIPGSVETVGYKSFQLTSSDGLSLTIDLTAFKDSTKIADCESDLLFLSDAEKVTFKIDSNLNEKDFTDKGWPANGTEDAPPIEWVQSTSLA